MGGALFRAVANAYGYVQPGAVSEGAVQFIVHPEGIVGNQREGVIFTVEPGGITGMHPGAFTFNISDGFIIGCIVAIVACTFAAITYLKHLAAVPVEVTYLTGLVVAAAFFSGEKFWGLCVVITACLVLNFVASNRMDLSKFKGFVPLFVAVLLILAALHGVYYTMRLQETLDSERGIHQEMSKQSQQEINDLQALVALNEEKQVETEEALRVAEEKLEAADEAMRVRDEKKEAALARVNYYIPSYNQNPNWRSRAYAILPQFIDVKNHINEI